MTVAWNTFKPLTKPTVRYGLSPHSLVHKVSSSSSITYNTSRTWANTVKLAHLRPFTEYCKQAKYTCCEFQTRTDWPAVMAKFTKSSQQTRRLNRSRPPGARVIIPHSLRHLSSTWASSDPMGSLNETSRTRANQSHPL